MFSLTIIVGVLQLSFCLCGLSGYMIRTKKSVMDVEEYCSTILHPISMFHVDISMHVHEHLLENLIHQGIAVLEYITLVV